MSDLPLQVDERNQKRYEEFAQTYGTFGVFRLPDGGVVRHHDMDAIRQLLSGFELVDEKFLDGSTMNGHPVRIFQIVARK